jgi:hypothetical protein
MPLLQPPNLQSLGIANRFIFGGVLPAQTVTGDAGCYAPAGGPASPESVSEEHEIYTDYDGCHRHHVKPDQVLPQPSDINRISPSLPFRVVIAKMS